jgi:hypothetical protein
MCGGTDVIKQDGVFVCQSCGVKYSPEEAKKMLVEVTGEVSVKGAATDESLVEYGYGLIEVDIAKAKESFDKALEINPQNYKAWLGYVRIWIRGTANFEFFPSKQYGPHEQYQRYSNDYEIYCGNYDDCFIPTALLGFYIICTYKWINEQWAYWIYTDNSDTRKNNVYSDMFPGTYPNSSLGVLSTSFVENALLMAIKWAPEEKKAELNEVKRIYMDDAKIWADKFIAEIEEENKRIETTSKKQSGCFITTAVCVMQNKPDDCYELTAFRTFRDNWLAQMPEGQTAIQEYYDVAPRIVERINKHKNKREIYDGIYKKYLLPCLSLIEAGDNQACFEKYKEMVDKLRRYSK